MKKLLLLITFFAFISCSTESVEIYTLSANVEPSEAGTVSPTQGEYDEGDEITLTATANTGWVFAEWHGDYNGTSNPASIMMNSDKNITARFEMREYDLKLETEGGGTIDEQIITSKTKSYQEGTTVQLTAVPDEGREFVEWSGDLSGSTNPATITIDEEKSVTAHFKAVVYEVTTETIGQGEIIKQIITAGSGEIEMGTVLEFTAVPDNDYEFIEWSGDISGDENPIQVTVEDDMNITAVFEAILPSDQTVSKFDLGNNITLNSVQFLTDDLGWVAGSGLIAKTTDGGENWIYQNEDLYVDEIQMIDENTGYVIEFNSIYKTTDGGVNWDLIHSTDDFIFTLNFIDVNTGWIGGENNLVLKTEDGGETWTKQDQFVNALSSATRNIRDFQFMDENNGWAAGDYSSNNRLLARTDDGGETWEVVHSGMGAMLNFVYMLDDNSGFTGSLSSLYSVSDGGETLEWEFQHQTEWGGSVQSVIFTSENQGYLLGYDEAFNPTESFFYETADQGQSWTQIETNEIIDGKAMDLGEDAFWIVSGSTVFKVEL
jgi:photosystem II stability/assembly factor-like uncharacterized protein